MKLTDDEYKILQDLYKDGYKWLCRDVCGTLLASKKRPYCNTIGDWFNTDICLDYMESIFTFVKVNSPKPYSIKKILKNKIYIVMIDNGDGWKVDKIFSTRKKAEGLINQYRTLSGLCDYAIEEYEVE